MTSSSPVVLIMLFGVAVAAAKMLGVLPGVADPPVVGVPTVLTDRLPGGAFLTGTTTLLSGERDARVDQSALRRYEDLAAIWTLHYKIEMSVKDDIVL